MVTLSRRPASAALWLALLALCATLAAVLPLSARAQDGDDDGEAHPPGEESPKPDTHWQALADDLSSQQIRSDWQKTAMSLGGELVQPKPDSNFYYLKFAREGGPRPAIAIFGGLPASESLSATVLRLFLDYMQEDERRALLDAILENADLYLIPESNWGVRDINPLDPRISLGGVTQAYDDDRDGKSDEDGPRDLDGDHMISQMRIPRKGGAYIASNDGRFMLPVKSGEIGTHDLMWEGADDDGDGRINEDAIGTVSLLNDFAIKWESKRDDAALFPMQQRATRDIADFLIAHPNICAAIHMRMQGPSLCFALGVPPNRKGESPDALWLEKLATSAATGVFAESVDLKAHEHGGGSLLDWIYEGRGAYAFDLNPFVLQKAPKPEPSEKGDVPKHDPRLDWHETWMLDSPKMFKDWKAFTHPQLGPVEIGGWEIGTGWLPNGDVDVTEANYKRSLHWLKDLAAMLPQVAVEKCEAQWLGDDLWRVRLTLTNSGGLPYRPKLAVKNRTGLPIIITLVDGDVTLVSGVRKQFAESIDPGTASSFEWLVSGSGESMFTVNVSGERMPAIPYQIALQRCQELKPELDDAHQDAQGGK